jgi:hypothetical protein
MAKSIYKYETSKVVNAVKVKESLALDSPDVATRSFFCNSLEEKRSYYYFQAGPWGAPGYQCGLTARRIAKNQVAGHSVMPEPCRGGMTIYQVFLV